MTSAAAYTSARFIDIHVVQSVPFANLNRDDNNSVKTVRYGDTDRTRVSSQSWKRAVRQYFQHSIGEHALRTRRVGARVAHLLENERGWPTGLAQRAGQHAAAGSSIKFEIGKNEPVVLTNAMVYVPGTAVTELADLAEEFRAALDGAKDIKKSTDKSVLPQDRIDTILRSRNGVINLFGRMLAEVDDAGVDGAVQVAHALTTHGTDVELDYFSAVDDVTSTWGDTTGSAHMGHAEFSAGVFYRYATVDISDLLTNLGGDRPAAKELTEAFIEAFILSLPQAKKTATAPHTIPDLVHLSVRSDRPLSYAAAFEKPVRSHHDGGYAGPSRAALDAYATAAHKLLGRRGVLASGWASLDDKDLNGLGTRTESFPELIDLAVTAALGPADAEVHA
ncbi:type I-E CRISPR-associated protein Cas7/Cse4/CasC [Kitasatospora sp. MAP5-34]|uniref:type I-E CRISPR-associated protein Cas7/Cse4/CasC n=1 Tax=Kitasatospora sp. MAP5-34 TaxID=3035102 RepID=UPI0024733FD1|nr:type I-E CRISPR-associated protein Cas7/Cse4/CasC [Kitasatospora sp. MAP5-34]MDH6575188.1 CRISPR system Cascade subunit CasC [Kitasatospora sp. MAP5-34]